ncbi:transposase [Pseudochelatococcus contaminans]|uniref:Transposase n=1 Tax=Pseudochelatococcus contaminans TaxID=1538103 RepID=A0A7W6EI69_9HYPH|nr:transposase [Pseudochelatococcus contaminans]MBB3810427.1 transposase [Pseudochelatococcus contaminans]
MVDEDANGTAIEPARREHQMARISPFFPLPHGVPRVDDRRVVSGIVYVIRNGLQ